MTKNYIDQLIAQNKYVVDWKVEKDMFTIPHKSKGAMGLFYYQPEVVFKGASNKTKPNNKQL